MVIDLFYWFDKSTKRKASLAEYCTFCDTSYREIVKHVNTRWLSLERAVGRVLQQYVALRSYCLSEGTYYNYYCYNNNISNSLLDNTAPRFQRLHDLFSMPMTEIHLLFYQSALQVFIHFNYVSPTR